MLVSAINQSQQNTGFGKLIIKPGSFEAIKQIDNFPPKDDPRYKEYLLEFYKKLMVLKKRCENNLSYNVVLKPEADKYTKGKLILEDSEGMEISSFQTSFRKLTEFFGFQPKILLTQKEEPRMLTRYFKNKKIKEENIHIEKEPRNYTSFFDTVIRRIERFVIDAESLNERRKIKIARGEIV